MCGGGEEQRGGIWLIIITVCKAAVNKDVDLIVNHRSGRIGMNEVFRDSDFKILVYHRGPYTMVYLPLVGCETISDDA